jgi:OPA family sugar phosphate sensor protein UhpC-like MFS transporter
MEVIKSPGIWVLAIATGCLYIGRYGIEHWAPLFLQTAKGHSAGTAGWIISSYSIGGVFGLAGSGFISEHLFRGNRYIPMLVFDIVAVLMIAALYLISAEHVVTQAIILALIGFTLCATMVYKSGLMAVDLVSRRAAGAAIGLVGLFSYVAAAIQDTVTGRLLEHSKVVVGKATQYSYHGVFAFWITSLCISTLLVVALGVYTVLRKKKMTPA